MPKRKFPFDIDMLSLDVAKRIRDEIEKAGYTQVSFAKKFGKHESWVSAKLKEVRNLTVDDVSFFASSLKIPISKLFPKYLGIDLAETSFLDIIRAVCLEVLKENKKKS